MVTETQIPYSVSKVDWSWQKKESMNLKIDQLKLCTLKNREIKTLKKSEQSFRKCETPLSMLIYA